MYNLVEISESEITRFLKLKNMQTGDIVECFDDSAVVSDINFNFIQMNHQYDCKIKLFGKVVNDKTDQSIACKIINKDTIIGQKSMVEVLADNKQYYITKKNLENHLDNEIFYFYATRKDLIQVDNVIHADYL
ncbi:MAG: hypothetical protein IKD21_00810 [Clostridia bacterium]|nr:hypothetical protein [Clostridia bacterium]